MFPETDPFTTRTHADVLLWLIWIILWWRQCQRLCLIANKKVPYFTCWQRLLKSFSQWYTPSPKHLGASWCKDMFLTLPDFSTSGLPITCCKPFSQILFSLGIPHPLCFILFLLLVYQSYSECHVTFTDQPFLMNTGWCGQKVKGIPGQFFFPRNKGQYIVCNIEM